MTRREAASSAGAVVTKPVFGLGRDEATRAAGDVVNSREPKWELGSNGNDDNRNQATSDADENEKPTAPRLYLGPRVARRHFHFLLDSFHVSRWFYQVP